MAPLGSYNRQLYYKTCNAMLRSTDKKPSDRELKKLVPLITAVNDLETFMVLLSRTFDEPAAKDARESLVIEALKHVIKQRLVHKNRDFLYFNNVLETCRGQAWLPHVEYEILLLDARKVNNANCELAHEMEAMIENNAGRLDAHEQRIEQLADDVADLETKVLLNREAINSTRLYVKQLDNRLKVTETNVQTIANRLLDFHRSYVERLRHEERVKKIKRVAGIFAALVGLVAAPVLHVAFDAAIDLANPIDVFGLVYPEADIVDFLVDTTNEHVLKEGVKHLLEQAMVPEDAFKLLLWEEIVLLLPHILDKSEKHGHVRNRTDLFRLVRKDRQLAPANGWLANRRLQSPDVSSIPSSGASATPADEALADSEVKPKTPADENTLTPLKDTHATGETKAEVPAPAVTDALTKNPTEEDTANQQRQPTVKVEVESPKREPVREDQPWAKAQTASTETVSRLYFAQDMDGFQYHVAVLKSQGQLTRFCELLDVDTGDHHHEPLTAMAMQIVTTSTTHELLSPADYAYCLGYVDVGDYFAELLKTATTKKTLAKTVKLLEKEKAFPYISVVLRTHGDVELCKHSCELVQGSHPLDACIRAKVVRETKKHVVWSAVEYASRLEYVDIVKYLLNEKCQKISYEAKVQLLDLTWAQHRRQVTRQA